MLSQKLFQGRKAGVLLVAMLASCIAVVSVATAQNNRQGYLGVTTQTLTDELREGLDFSYDGEGALINNVSDGSPADRAGLRTGDIIIGINSESVTGSNELRRVVRGLGDGEQATVRFIRDGSPRSFSVRLDGIDENGVSGDEFDWRSGDEMPAPPVAPRAPRAPRAPKAPSEPRTYWFHEDNDGHVRESLKGLDRLKDLEGLKGLEGLEGFEGMDGGDLMTRTLGRGRLGVQIEDLDDDLAEALGVESGRGALVRSVVNDSPAKRAGIRGGDIITRINNQSIDDSEDLMTAVRGLNEGPARITVIRRGASQTLTANLAAREDLPNAMRFHTPRADRMRERGMLERGMLDRGDRLRERAGRLRERSDRTREGTDLQREVEDLKREVERLRRELDRRDER